MAKKNNDINLGIFESLGIKAENSKNNKSNVENTVGVNSDINSHPNHDKPKNNSSELEEIKSKSPRGRKKKGSDTSVKFIGKKVVISKKDESIIKKNKTFYIDNKHIQTLENISERTGMTTSELVEIAIQLLNNNLELEGFND